MKRVYVVLSTTHVGGAEKRFTDVWCALTDAGRDIHLIMDRRAHKALRQQEEYTAKLREHPKLHVLDFPGTGYAEYVQAIWHFFAGQPRNCIVHYPLAYVPLVQSRYGHRLVVSWVNSSLPRLRRRALKNTAMAWTSFIAADLIDVLNPENVRRLSDFPVLRRKVSLTAGGTHVDPRVYRPREKALDFVFLSRVEPEKQSLRLVRELPEVHRKLQQWGLHGYRFVVCGDGSEAPAIRAALSTPEYVDLPLSFGYSADPHGVLGQASVFFSLQRTSNYPSKALAEAMASGAYPVLTQTGESVLMVEGCPHHAFVPRDFSAVDIASSLRGFLLQPAADRARMSRELSEYAHKKFTIANQAAYFAQLYEKVSRS